MAEYRGDQCPARIAGLTHAFGPADPQGICVHCQKPLTTTPPAGVPYGASQAYMPPEQAEVRHGYAEVFDHLYVFTITGRCGHANCGRVKDAHASYMIGTEPGDCTVDHRSVQPWTECGICGVPVEPKMADKDRPNTIGPGFGPGRLPFIKRHWDALERLRLAWLGGYYES